MTIETSLGIVGGSARAWLVAVAVLVELGALAARAPAASAQAAPPAVAGADIEEHFGAQVPMDATFLDQDGRPVKLGDVFRGKPVVMAVVYFTCPMLCELILSGMANALRPLDWKVGDEFEAVTVSFDPDDRPEAAKAKRLHVLELLGAGESAPDAWPVLTGDKTQIDRLTSALGFKYEYDPKTGEYAHPAVIFVLGPSGKISRYLYGVTYNARDIKFALIEAGRGKVGNLAERVLVTCYQYDPSTRRYGAYVYGFMRLGAGLVLLVVAGGLGMLWWRERRRGKERP